MSDFQILSARAVRAGGLPATRYRLRRDHAYTGLADLDAALSTFDALIVPPEAPRSRAAAVTLLGGITKPLAASVPAALALARGGIGAILLDTPLGGTRRPGGGGSPASALHELVQREVALDVPLVARMFDGVAHDLAAAFALGEAEHDLGGPRALFGVSFGCLLSSFAFGRDGLGDRLIGAIGHPDLPAMARGMVETFTRFSGVPAAVISGGLRMGPLAEAAARRLGGEQAVGALRFARLLNQMGRGGRAMADLDPLVFASGGTHASGETRPVAFLAGALDPVAPPEAIRASARAYANSAVEVMPALGHGWYPGAMPPGAQPFGEACGAFALRQVQDWA